MELLSIADIVQLPFRSAATAWLESRRYHLAPRTFDCYSRYIIKIAPFFREMKIPEITGDQLRAYQHARRMEVDSSVVNKELSVIVMIRKRLGCPLTDYQRLPADKFYEPPGRALEEHEEETLLRVCREAADHQTWDTAALTTASVALHGPRTGRNTLAETKACPTLSARNYRTSCRRQTPKARTPDRVE